VQHTHTHVHAQKKSCINESNDRNIEKHITTSAECLGYRAMQLIILHDSQRDRQMKVEYSENKNYIARTFPNF